MSKRRLSKLQIWILDRILENIRNKRHTTFDDKVRQFMYRGEIYEHYFKLSHPNFGTWPASKRVIVSRSLRNLEEKGYITIPKHIRPRGCMIFYSKKYIEAFNDVMKEKALKLTK